MMKMTSEQLYAYVTLLNNLDVLIKLDREEKKKAEENSDDFFAGMEDTRYTARLHKTADELDAFRREHREELDGLCEMLGAYQKESGRGWYIKRRKLMVNGDEATAFFFNVEEEFNLDAELRKMKF